MQKIKVRIGSKTILGPGEIEDNRRVVEFVAEELASDTKYEYSDRTGKLSDSRGITRTLYRTSDGRFIVHIEEWSKWQGEPNYSNLYEISPADLAPGGKFEYLGNKAGLSRPLTLDEALAP